MEIKPTQPSRAEQWLRSNSGLALCAVGAVLLALGGFVLAEVATATAVAVVGAGALVLAVLLPRSEGPLKLGPGGLEVLLSAVAQRSEEAQLDEEEHGEALRATLERWEAFTQLAALTQSAGQIPASKLHGPLITTNYDAELEQRVRELADDVVHDIAALIPVTVEEVPEDAVRTIQEVAGLSGPPTVLAAERRSGRGAPRWHLVTDAGRWRVSNTRHGWNARRLSGE